MSIFGFILFCLNSFALDDSANSCDDYIARHQKRDLVPLSFTYRDIQNSLAKEISLIIKNKGEVDMNSLALDVAGVRPLQVTMNGQTVETKFHIPLDSGETETIKFNIKTSGIRECAEVEVVIDSNHSAGQWGCGVWNNDSVRLKAVKQGSNCIPRIPDLRIPNRPIIR